MSRMHDNDLDVPHIICGDFNTQNGEDHWLTAEGWRDAWLSSKVDWQSDSWTWKRGQTTARYDRVYMRNSSCARATCKRIERLVDGHDTLSDHAALYAEIAIIPFVSGIRNTRVADSSVSHAESLNKTTPACKHADVGTCRDSSLETFSANRLTDIAFSVKTAVEQFHRVSEFWHADPLQAGQRVSIVKLGASFCMIDSHLRIIGMDVNVRRE